MKPLLLAFTAFFFLVSVSAQEQELYQKKWLVKETDTLPYRLLLPKNFDAKKEYPLILFLHGSGERGRDNEAQLIHGGELFANDSIRNAFPAITVFPQCPLDSYWSNVQFQYDSLSKKRTFHFSEGGEPTVAMKMLLKLVDELKDKYRIDRHRMYVGGLSMGGMGTFELVYRKPKVFAAAFPICGGANMEIAPTIRKTDWWIFHGMKDDVVPPYLSQNMAAALQTAGAEVKLTLYPAANHNSWDAAFAEKDLLPWIFSKHH